MRKIYLSIIVIALMLSFNSFAQQPTLAWAYSLPCSATSSTMGHITQTVNDASGNLYSIGYFIGTIDLDQGPSTYTFASNGGSYDIFIQKTDANGNFLWGTTIGGTSDDEGKSIFVDGSGNIYTTGIFYGTVDFSFGSGSALTSTGTGEAVFIQKLDNSGNYLWSKSIGGSNASYPSGSVLNITADALGNVYLAGEIEGGTVDFDPGSGVHNISCPGYNNWFVQKLDVNGNFVWAKVNGNQYYYSNANQIKIDPSGNLLIYGVLQNVNQNLTKLTPAGTQIWSWAPPCSWAWFDLDAGGNIYSTGSYTGAVDFDPGAGTYNLFSSGGNDIFIEKLDSGLNFVWAKSRGGASDDYGTGVKVSPTGDVYLAGSFGSSANFNPGGASYNLTSSAGSGMFAQRLNLAGNFVWAAGAEGSVYYPNIANGSLLLDANANLYFGGLFQGTCDFDPVQGPIGTYSIASSPTGHVNPCVFKWFNSVASYVPAQTTICANIPVTFTNTSTGAPTSYTWTLNGGSPAISNAANPMVSYATPGTYTVLLTETYTGGGTSSTTGTITVAGPAISISPSNGNICQGQGSTLTAGGATTYTWSANAGSVISNTVIVYPTNNTIYTVTGTLSGCSTSQTVAVNATPSPTINATPSQNPICSGIVTTLTASGATNYTWSANAGSATTNTVAVSPSSSTTYTVTGSSGGCAATQTVLINVNLTPNVTANASTNPICSGLNATLTAGGTTTYTWDANAGSVTTSTVSVSPSSNTTYTVTGTSGGCSSTQTISIGVTTTPTIVIQASPQNICSGANSLLTVSGATTYTWSANAGSATTNTASVSPSVTTIYSVMGKNGSCSSSNTVTVTVNPTPATPTITLIGIALNSSSANGNQWYLNGNSITGATAQTYTPTQNGNYTVIVTTNGCSSISSAVNNYNTSINTNETIADNIEIYPNPNDGNFMINLSTNKTGTFIIEILNSLGQVIQNETFIINPGDNKKECNLSQFGKGFYLINITDIGLSHTIKRVIVN